MFRISLPLGDSAQLAARYHDFSEGMEEPLHATQRLLEKTLANHNLSPTIYCRIKKFSSLYDKVLKKLRANPAPPRGEIILTDVMGIRIVCPFLEDLERTVALLRSEFTIFEVDNKGEMLTPFQFGYNSIHLQMAVPDKIRRRYSVPEDVSCEIQVRTILQEAWAQVEHEIMYKADFTPFGEPLKRKLSALSANLTLSDIIFQEIRDYQRGLQEELARRRDSFQMDIISKTGDDYSLPENGTSPFDKTVGEPINPGGGSVDTMLVHALREHNAGRFDEAEKLYSGILEKVETPVIRAIIYIHRGMAAFGRMDYPRALEDFSRAGEADGTNAKAWYFRGVVYRVVDEPERALEDFTRSIGIDPYQTEPLMARARLLYRTGDLPGVLKDCRKALELNSSLAEARELHGLVVQKLHGVSIETGPEPPIR